MKHARAALWSSACALALAHGCSPQRSHLFNAFRYDPVHDCLESYAAVDVLEGPDPGACDRLRCWVSPGDEVYITTDACEAPPGYQDRSADPEPSDCARALAAWAEGGAGRCAE